MDYRSRTLKGSLVERGHYPSVVVFSPDGHTIASTDANQSTELWDVMTMKLKCPLVGSFDTQDNEGNEYFGVAYSPDGNAFAIGSEDGTIRMWDTTTGNLKHTFIGNITSVGSFCFSPDGTTIAAINKNGIVQVWDTKGGVPIIYGYEEDTRVRLKVPLATGKHIYTFECRDSVVGILFSPDGDTLTTVCTNNTVQVWNTETGDLKYTLKHDSRSQKNDQ